MTPSQWTAVRESAVTIAANAQYVLRELDRLEVPGEWRQRVRAVWQDLGFAAERMKSAAARGEAGRMRHPFDEIGWIETGPERALRVLDGLVQDLGQGPESGVALGLLSILVTESAANIVRAYSEAKRHAKAIRAALPAADAPARTIREEAGLPEGADLVRRLTCAECGRTAATLEAGIDPLTGDRALVYSGLVRGEAFGLRYACEIFAMVDEGRIGAVHVNLGAEGIDAYCPQCRRIYCSEHYALATEYDEGFYDCTRATCPAGHRRMVDD
jgi:hypothetical protein